MELTADNIAAEVSGMTPCIMVVEDDDSTRATLKEALKQLGRVVDFDNPQDALSYLDGHGCVDAIITDMMMKEMHGVEFCTQVRERFNRDFLPILIYSSFNDPQLEKLALMQALTTLSKSQLVSSAYKCAFRFTCKTKAFTTNCKKLPNAMA